MFKILIAEDDDNLRNILEITLSKEGYPALCIPDDARKGKMLFMQFNPENIEDTLKCKLFRFSPDYPKSAIDLDIYDTIAKINAPQSLIQISEPTRRS